MSPTATVIGGGVVGLACGIEIARRGVAVTLVDADIGRGAASWGNAGHLAIEQVEPLASWALIRSAPRRMFSRGGPLAFPARQWRVWLPFALRMMAAAYPPRFAVGTAALSALSGQAMSAWQTLAARLTDDTLLHEDGHFVLWGSAETAGRGRAAWATSETGPARHREAVQDELRMLTRLLGSQPGGAIRVESSGQIADLGRLADMLEVAFDAAGGSILRGTARLVRVGDRAGVAVDGGEVAVPDHIVLAAGVRSRGLIAPIGHGVPLVAERGYHIRTRDHALPAGLPPLVFEDRSMIVTRFSGCAQAAGFTEFGSADAPADVAKWERLERHVVELGLPMRAPFERWMGARPTLPDYLPAIGRSRRAGNLVYAFGHQHLGLTLAAATAEIVGALIASEAPPIDIDAFDIDRFAGWRRAR